MTGVEWRETEKGLVPFTADGQEVIWAPQPPSQTLFLSCTFFECLLEGPRGGGKTDALLMDFAQHCGRGFGSEWQGILFRQTFPQLRDVITKTKKWFPQVFPNAVFNESKVTWTWPGGETLRLSYIETEEDYWNYHGHAYPWIGFEELTTWPDDTCYRVMFSCCRSTRLHMPRKYRATTNPAGPGHNWVKQRFALPVHPEMVRGPIIEEKTSTGGIRRRVAIRALLTDNRVLLRAEPDYQDNIRKAARHPAELKAWLEGDWNIVAGGMFDDVWRPEVHVIPDIPFKLIPKTWKINRSYDHGQSRPFSVGWWAESNGEPIEFMGRTYGAVKGDIIRIAEWYGCTSQPNEGLRLLATEIADGIRERQRKWGIDSRVKAGPADTSIFDAYEPGKSVAGDMKKKSVTWIQADKRPGSRIHGWDQMRKLLKQAIPGAEGTRDKPGLFVCASCDAFIRTVPVLPRDKRDMDDVDTKAEDHVADEARYRVRQKSLEVKIVDG